MNVKIIIDLEPSPRTGLEYYNLDICTYQICLNLVRISNLKQLKPGQI